MTESNTRHDEWVRLYTEEMLSCGRIAEQYGVTERAVAFALMKREIPRRRPDFNKIGEELQKFYPEWAKMYNSGATLEKIAEEYHVGVGTVWRAMERMGVERRSTGEHNRKYAIRNANAFDCIDTDKKAYFFGIAYG